MQKVWRVLFLFVILQRETKNRIITETKKIKKKEKFLEKNLENIKTFCNFAMRNKTRLFNFKNIKNGKTNFQDG